VRHLRDNGTEALARFRLFLSTRCRRVLDLVDNLPVGPPDGARRSAVLVCLRLFGDASPSVLFVVRSRLLTHHPGQIGFPGGRVEEGDGGPVDTALREAREEVDILPSQVELLGLLDDQYTRVSQHVVTPVLVRLLPDARPCIASDENERLFHITADELEAGGHVIRLRAPGEPWCRERQWQFPTAEGPLWGLSARITHNLLEQFRLFRATDGPGG
jgi:8-oxo-dGTP pyrophosphatase MutT (NUDIX family)